MSTLAERIGGGPGPVARARVERPGHPGPHLARAERALAPKLGRQPTDKELAKAAKEMGHDDWHDAHEADQAKRQTLYVELQKFWTEEILAIAMVAVSALRLVGREKDFDVIASIRKNGTALKCATCKRVYPIKDDIPVMLIDEAKIEDEQPAGNN